MTLTAAAPTPMRIPCENAANRQTQIPEHEHRQGQGGRILRRKTFDWSQEDATMSKAGKETAVVVEDEGTTRRVKGHAWGRGMAANHSFA